MVMQADDLGQTYTIRFKNRSASLHDFLCYQQGVDVNRPNVYTLAWFAKPVASGVDVDFSWTVDYSFLWSEQGQLVPGVTFKARQVVPAGLDLFNKVNFTKTSGAFHFDGQSSTGALGSLTIHGEKDVPKGQSSFGIGMSGTGTFLVDAEPNLTAIFTPRPTYWITFGSYEQGEVLDIQTLVNVSEVAFPQNVFGMTAELDSGNNWILSSGLN